MTQLNQIYKCNVCGNMVSVVHTGVGELVCCGQPMQLLKAKTQEEGQEKHLPVVEKTPKGIKVKVGAIPHPMEEKHYIEWIAVVADGKTYRQFLKPGTPAEATFEIETKEFEVFEYCNIHGLWKA